MQQRRTNFRSSAVFLLLALVFATVASVPTSVLVQKSEMASNNNSNNNKSNGNNNNNHFGNFKVKRSSNNLKESAAAAAAALNKKSSPEIVPDSYNSPSQASSSTATSSSLASSAARQFNADDSSSSMSNSDSIINSAIAAGLTAAAIEAAAVASQRQGEQQRQLQYATDDYDSNDGIEAPTLLRKRGISSQQYLYGGNGAVGNSAASYGYTLGNPDYYINPSAVGGGGVAAMRDVGGNGWSDDVEPYSDAQEYDSYSPRALYRNKAYDNLQNILNSESSYLEPVALPLQYPSGRYYDVDAKRKKRSNLNKLNQMADIRLKRDTKLTPADMLALVALVEAGERARKDSDASVDSAAYTTYAEPYTYSGSNNNNNNLKPTRNNYYANAYDYQLNNNNIDAVGEYNGDVWLEPALVDYYGVPYNLETLPKYELPPREHKYQANNRYSSKRFMVAKKKRSLGQFLNQPVAKPSFSYNAARAEKYF